MLNELLLHPITKEALTAVLHNHPHALLLQGKRGSGKGYIAKVLATELLQTTFQELEKQPYFMHIIPENEVIKIEQVRQLKQFMQLKTAGKVSVRRVVIIEDIMTMGDEAQNALLKLLEEPPADTVIILTSAPSSAVRPTIISRSQVVSVLPPPKHLIGAYYQQKGYKQSVISKALAMSQGSVGLINALLADQEHPLIAQVELAKELLSSSEYQRLTKIDTIAKDRLAIEALLEALTIICNAALQQTARANDNIKLKRWYKSIKAVDQARQALTYKPNGKLLLTNLFLQL